MTDTPSIGHNIGTDPMAHVRARVDQLIESANAWLSQVKAIADVDTAKACDSFLTQIKAEIAALEVERKAKNKPHDEAVDANNNAYRPFTALLSKAKDLLTPLKTAWLQREQSRIAAEKKAAEEAALRKMQEAEDAKRWAGASVEAAVIADEAQAAADLAVQEAERATKAKATVKGEFASRASGLRTYWSAVITDYPKALVHYAKRQEVMDLIQRLADADAREHKDTLAVPGVKPDSQQKAA